MAKGVNKVILLGNLGKDPELKQTPNGTSVSTFSLALNRSVKNGDSWKQVTEWVRCVAWEKQAEVIAEFVRKGQPLYLEGRLQTREWTDGDNIKRYSTEVIVQDFTLLGSKPNNLTPSTEDGFAQPLPVNQPVLELEAEDIPF
jgi:single-strand DNA-binding protein